MSSPAEERVPGFVLHELSTEDEQDQVPPARVLHAGDLCPVCGVEHLDYDGLLNLSCPNCGPAAVGCFT